MAESYIIKIKFEPTNQSLKETEKKLNNVFTRVTRSFRKGLKKVWTGLKLGAGVTAIGTALASLLSPLAALNDKINGTLDKAGSIKDRAAGAGTDIKSYLALRGYAASKGINEDALNTAMAHLQTMVGAAKSGEKNALWNYRDQTDMAKVFYNVINAIAEQKDPALQAKAASDVFGARAVTQLGPLVSEGFKREDFAALLKGVDLSKAQNAIEGLDKKGDLQAQLAFKREVQDLINKNRLITDQTIKMQDAQQRARGKKENAQLKSYESVVMIDITLKQLLGVVDKLVVKLEPSLLLLAGALQVISNLPMTLDRYWEKLRAILPKWLGGK